MTHTLVLLRHGQSTWNLENRFTGWKDVGLTEQGTQEACEAGRLMQAEGLDFDVVFTSLQRRAITTAFHALSEMDRLWLPVTKSWRLNERHYGALQGLNKKETTDQHGADQVLVWRRSYDVPPPALELSDERHPRNDPQYRALPADMLPATECLADVVVRMLPFWYDAIAPAMLAGKRVLIVAHGNSLRALVKHLEGISDDEITGLNIPTGIPLAYELDAQLGHESHRYLGDPEAAKKAAEAVANQAK